MSDKEAQQGRELFSSDEEQETIETLATDLSTDRPISVLETGIAPEGRTSHVWYQHTLFQGSVIVFVVGLFFFVFNAFLVGGSKNPKIVVAGDAQQVSELKQEMKDKDAISENQIRENSALTQEAQFEAIPIDPKNPNGPKRLVPVSNTTTAQAQTTPVTPARTNTPQTPNRGRIPQRRNTVTMPRRPAYTPAARPPSRVYRSPVAKQPAKSSKPSLSDCVEWKQSQVNVAACKDYNITLASAQQSPPVTLGNRTNTALSTPAPITRKPIKPIKLKPYTPPKIAALGLTASSRKKGPGVNLMAGEIQTMDQYEAEMNGSDGTSPQSSSVNVSMMEAKVVRHVEWRSEVEAQKIVIPLTITSGPKNGQQAQAKITSLAGTQFTAELIKIDGQPVRPGQYVLEQNSTAFLLAKAKTQGGSSFGRQVLGAALAVGGEIASDELGGVRGGNHISGLVPQNQQRGPTGQYWKFEGKVSIVKKS